MRRRGLLMCLLVAALLGSATVAQAAGKAKGFALVTKWTVPDIRSIAAGPNGDVYVLTGTAATGRIVKVFTSRGALRFEFRASSPSTGLASDIAVDSNGFVYVSDGEVDKFTASGAFIGKVAASDGYYVHPLATDTAGNLYMGSGANLLDSSVGPTVMKVSPSGALLAEWSTPWGPADLTVDAAGFVYIAGGDQESHSIYKFTNSGSLVTSWGGRHLTADQPPSTFLEDIGGLDVGPNGSIYGVQHINNFGPADYTVHEFSPSGASLGQFKPNLVGTRGLAVNSSGFIYLADGDGVQMYNPQPGKPKVKKGAGKTRKRKVSIKFSGSGAVGFECRLTGQRIQKKLKSWRGCRSPKRYGGLRLGRKVFQVRGIDAAGIRGEPATKKWMIIP